VVTFRPTVTQALARGAAVGWRIAACAGLLLVLAVHAGFVERPAWLEPLHQLPAWVAVGPLPAGSPVSPMPAGLALAAILVGLALGAAMAALLGRDAAVQIDDAGIRPAAERSTRVALWPDVVDLRTERYGRRTVVAVYLNTGEGIRLPAPYHGLLLAGDRQFERKFFMLRHLWETHRSFPVGSGEA
jgi:hypothetical protein